MTEEFANYFMRLAIQEAEKARNIDEVPTGAILIETPPPNLPPEKATILATAYNSTQTTHDPTAHAELLAIKRASQIRGDFRLTNTILFVTKEPCVMCAGAIILARIPLVVYGMTDPKRGGITAFNLLSQDALIHKAQTIPGILETECKTLMQTFFREKRQK